MDNISKIKLPNNVIYNLKDDSLSGIYSVKGTQSTNTSLWTGALDVPVLTDGMTIAYYLPYTSNANVTLNLTLSNNISTGAINVYFNGNTRMGTQFSAGSIIMLTYWKAGSISINGVATTDNRWLRADYNTNASFIASTAPVAAVNGDIWFMIEDDLEES